MRLIVIGAGPGGYETAVEAARRGLEVTLVSDGPLGGTCLNEGCIPTKSLIHNCCDKSLSLEEAQQAKASVLSTLRQGIEQLLKPVELVQGKARFEGPRCISVDGRKLEADRIIIATGSESAVLPVPGAEYAMTSSGMLSLEKAPGNLVIIGGGVIGLEFAGIFNSLGTKVTAIEYCPGILPRFDLDLAKRLKSQLLRSGISIINSAAVTSVVRRAEDSYEVNYTCKDTEMTLPADCVLMAVGRRPRTEGLNLEAAGIEYGAKGIKVDDRMRTSADGVYAVGDVTGGIMLAHVAKYQGLRALNDITGERDCIDFGIVPAVVFTTPELATVGLTEEDCKQRGIAYRALKSSYRANGKAVSSDAADGYCKLLAAEDGKILGCHILGAHASDLIHEAAVLMASGIGVENARWIIHAHPTLSEVLQSSLMSY